MTRLNRNAIISTPLTKENPKQRPIMPPRLAIRVVMDITYK